MLRLQGRIQHYDWGSLSAIPELVHLPQDGKPWAEIWFGAHPGAPALVSSAQPWVPALADESSVAASAPQPLDEWIARNHDAALGAGREALPFLVKLLAAGRPLSLQAHPDMAQAIAGYRAEQDAGTPRDQANYADSSHKPESLFALAPTRALAGFRRPAAIAADLDRIGSPQLEPIAHLLRAGTLRDAFTRLLQLPAADVQPALDALAVAVSDGQSWGQDAIAVAQEILIAYPGDVGVLATIFLNAVALAPGQALSVGAGIVHCYLSGLGLEVMANSDNVLRAGLTSKRVDVAELVRILNFEPAPALIDDPPVHAAAGAKVRAYPPHFAEYAVTVYELDGTGPYAETEAKGPRILLGLDGASTIESDQGRVILGAGDAAFAGDGELLRLQGTGTVAIVRVP
ncbi:mannose-6-phosphate isomerase, class I [Rarobacter faecitabidus]|uniref:mannose-6-phosphate isomerase n=1 Tax=Rarobacter faecitabidus TaxID=13243 RepID=A0A542ZAP7_RARFA|nr:mannose-6-phosphate isomerase, class I [Rarobacter faecitabidus]TQL57418.1 mannose-6-phosphate isomerase type 1 [Rarobacter faecitabidus]